MTSPPMTYPVLLKQPNIHRPAGALNRRRANPLIPPSDPPLMVYDRTTRGHSLWEPDECVGKPDGCRMGVQSGPSSTGDGSRKFLRGPDGQTGVPGYRETPEHGVGHPASLILPPTLCVLPPSSPFSRLWPPAAPKGGPSGGPHPVLERVATTPSTFLSHLSPLPRTYYSLLDHMLYTVPAFLVNVLNRPRTVHTICPHKWERV